MILLDGKPADCLPVTDRGLLYGDGAWETIAVTAGQPQLLEEHLQRLSTGLERLGIAEPDWAELRTNIFSLCQQSRNAVLKIIVTRGTGQRGYSPRSALQPRHILQITAKPVYPADYTNAGIHLGLCVTRLARQPLLAGFKHLNRLEQVLARAELGAEYQEGVMLDYAGQVIEGTMSNLFLLDSKENLYTPALTNCGIDGIMRGFVMKTLVEWGIACQIKALELDDLRNAKAVFMTNSLIGLWPVREFLGIQYSVPNIINELKEEVIAVI